MTQRRRFHFFSTPFLTALGRSGGLIIPFLVAFKYGAGPTTDAFFLAYGLNISIGSVFTPVFESFLLPYLTEQKKVQENINQLSSGVLVFCLPAVVILSFLVWVLLPWFLTQWSGLGPEISHLAARLFLEMIPVLILGVWTSAFNGIFHTHKIFWFPALSPLLRSLWVVAFLWLGHHTLGIHAVTLGYVIGDIFRWAAGRVLLGFLGRWKFQSQWKKMQFQVKDFLRQTVWQILGLLGINLIPLTDQWFASWLGAGKLSLASYSDRLFQVPYQLFLTGLLQVFLSYWSETYHEEAPESVWNKGQKDIRRAFQISFVLSILLALLQGPIVKLTFGFGHFSKEELKLIASFFGWLMLGFSPTVLNLLYARVLFVMRKSNVFFLQSWLRFFLNIFFDYLFMKWWGFQGIAISTTLVYVVTTVWLYGYLQSCQKARVKK